MNTTPVIPPRVSLREVRLGDLPILFEHQLDPEGARMAAFTSRDHSAFMAHWTKIMANPACALRVILGQAVVIDVNWACTGVANPVVLGLLAISRTAGAA